MVTATEALVSNMASEAANTVWTDFVERVRQLRNHPSQINGKKHLRTILREVEGAASICLNDLDTFTGRLQPAEPAAIARITWDRNYKNFINDLKTAHHRKTEELAKYT
jgi:hypothetical protein